MFHSITKTSRRSFSYSTFFKLFALSAFLFCHINTAHAQTFEGNNPKTFFRFICTKVNLSIDAGPVIASLNALLSALTDLAFDFGAARLKIDNPAKCLPGINLRLPGPEQLLACLAAGLPKIEFQTPNLSSFAGCLTNLLPNYSVKFPQLSREQLLSCLGNYSATINIGQIIQKLTRLIAAVAGLIASLTKLLPQISAVFNPKMIASLKWLTRFCTRTNGKVSTRMLSSFYKK